MQGENGSFGILRHSERCRRFIPFWAVYEILLAFINQNVTLNGILIWCLVGAAGYLLRVACHGISTILAHISAYTILEGIRLKIADRLMKAPLGEVMGRRIGYLKNIIMDKVEDLEPPLAHMIPELTSNLLLPVAIFTWMMVIDWRMGLAVLIAPVLAMIPMFFLMRNYNSQYAAYMEANNHVNSIIIEYVEGIEVVKAFNQSTSSYEKFVNAVQSFKEFTLAWFKSTWKSMNLMMAIMPQRSWGFFLSAFCWCRMEVSPCGACNGDYPFPQHCWTVDESNHFH